MILMTTMRFRKPRNCAPQLHFACQQRPLPVETIQELVEEHPLSVEVRGEDGWLPLHRVCRREPTVAVVRCLMKAWPASVNHWTGDGIQELGARLPIHLVCQHGASLEVVKFLATVQPETLEVPCLDHNMTPLDYAYQCWEEEHLPQTRAVIEWLESSVPSFQRNRHGRLDVRSRPEVSAAYEPRAPLNTRHREEAELPVRLKPPPEASRQTSGSTITTAAESSSSSDPFLDSGHASGRIDSASTTTTIPEFTVVNSNRSLECVGQPRRRMDYGKILTKIASLDSAPTTTTGSTESAANISGGNSLTNHGSSEPNMRRTRDNILTEQHTKCAPVSLRQQSLPIPSHHRIDSASTTTESTAETSDLSLITSRTPSEPDVRTTRDIVTERHAQHAPVSLSQQSVGISSSGSSTGPGSVISSSESTFTKSVSSFSSQLSSPIFRNRLLKPRRSAKIDKYSKRLMVACLEQPPSLVLVRQTIQKCRDAVTVPVPEDYMEYLPLHLACMSGASVDVIRVLVEAWLDSVKVANKIGYLPLHLCFTGKVASPDVVRYLISQYPDAVSMPAAQDGMLPLHCACYYGAPTSIIQVLVEQYPHGVLKINREDKTPLQLAKHPSAHITKDKETIKILKRAAPKK